MISCLRRKRKFGINRKSVLHIGKAFGSGAPPTYTQMSVATECT